MPIELQTNIVLVPEPASPSHVVNVKWVTDFFKGKQKAPVRVVARNNQAGSFNATDLEFTYTALTATVIDGVTLAVGDRVLFAGQTNPEENLVYEVTVLGDGTDPTELENAEADLETGTTITVSEGPHANQTFRLTTSGTITLGTSGLDWETYEPPKGAETFGEDFEASDGVADTPSGWKWEFEHKLNTTDVTVALYNHLNQLVFADVEVTDPDTVTVRFAEEPAAGLQYRVVVVG